LMPPSEVFCGLQWKEESMAQRKSAHGCPQVNHQDATSGLAVPPIRPRNEVFCHSLFSGHFQGVGGIAWQCYWNREMHKWQRRVCLVILSQTVGVVPPVRLVQLTCCLRYGHRGCWCRGSRPGLYLLHLRQLRQILRALTWPPLTAWDIKSAAHFNGPLAFLGICSTSNLRWLSRR